MRRQRHRNPRGALKTIRRRRKYKHLTSRQSALMDKSLPTFVDVFGRIKSGRKLKTIRRGVRRQAAHHRREYAPTRVGKKLVYKTHDDWAIRGTGARRRGHARYYADYVKSLTTRGYPDYPEIF